MIEVEDMSHSEIVDVLTRVRYGHLGCSKNDHPYVVPTHFAYGEGGIYIFTTEGKKSEIIDKNREVCLQVEDVVDDDNWTSVIVIGNAEKLLSKDEREKGLQAVSAVNPSLTPALSVRWVDNWVREIRDIDVIYRIQPVKMTGRRTAANPAH
jgi:nitroimidazol reductase NimA-like FMN-containing flavoprotein (pyridoxamine 5'-phosphate oxidase superfamily)